MSVESRSHVFTRDSHVFTRDLLRIIGDLRAALRSSLSTPARKVELDKYFPPEGARKLHLGAGPNLIAGWLNTDAVPTQRGVYRLDVTNRFPFPDGQFDFVFSEHVIEHLEYRSGKNMLAEAHRVLREGGRIRITTPGIDSLISHGASTSSEDPGEYVGWAMGRIGAEPSVDPTCIVLNNVFLNWGHRFLYNRSSLQRSLEAVGFHSIRHYEPGETEDDHFMGIEARESTAEARRSNHIESIALEGEKRPP